MSSVFYKVEIVAIAMGKGFAELEGSSLDDFNHKVSKSRKQWGWLTMIKRGEKQSHDVWLKIARSRYS